MTETKIHLEKDSLLKTVETLKKEGKKIVFTNGCFDILHSGHITLLETAREQGDVLLVALNSDTSVKKIKGPERPVNSESDRCRVMASLQCVDLVTVFSESTPENLIEQIMPDVLVKGGDWKPDEIVGSETVTAAGGKVVSIPFLEGYSTTKTLEKVLASGSDKSLSLNGGDLFEKTGKGDLKSLGRILTLVDSSAQFRKEIYSKCLERKLPLKKKVIGFSGPPGSGKSTVVSELITRFCKKGKRVGVIAVDPSSTKTGGAFLGDRIRARESFSSDQLFFRSLGSKGVSGGISEAVEVSAALLQHAGYEMILVETVGGGQSDVDISKVTEHVVLVQSPVLGDSIQMMKSGLNEFAECFLVNKSDLSGAKEYAEELKMHLEESGHENIPVFLCSALSGEGMEPLLKWIEQKI